MADAQKIRDGILEAVGEGFEMKGILTVEQRARMAVMGEGWRYRREVDFWEEAADRAIIKQEMKTEEGAEELIASNGMERHIYPQQN